MIGETLKQIDAIMQTKIPGLRGADLPTEGVWDWIKMHLIPTVEWKTPEDEEKEKWLTETIAELNNVYGYWRANKSKRISALNDVLSRISKLRWGAFAPKDCEDVRALLSKGCTELMEEMGYRYNEKTNEAEKIPKPKKAKAGKEYVPTGLPIINNFDTLMSLLNSTLVEFTANLPGKIYYKLRKRTSYTPPEGETIKGRLVQAKMYYRQPAPKAGKLMTDLIIGEYNPDWLEWLDYGEVKLGEKPEAKGITVTEYRAEAAAAPAPTPAPATKIWEPNHHYLPANPLDRLFRVPGTNEIYELSDWQGPMPEYPEGFGTRIWIKDPNVFNAIYGPDAWGKVKDITKTELERYILMPFEH